MNQKELENIRRENLNKLDTAYRPKINAIEIDINNSIEHSLALTICQIMIRRGVPANLLPSSFKWDKLTKGEVSWKEVPMEEWEKLSKELGRKFKHEWQRPQVVTEARFKYIPSVNSQGDWDKETMKKNKQRRADIFILDTSEIVEIETGKSTEKEGVITVRI